MIEKTVQAQVETIAPLTDSITQLVLNPAQYVPYQAGQYLQIILGDEEMSYSIANAPLGSHKYELHIRHSLENSSNQRLFAHIKEHGEITIRLPFGNCSMNHLDKERPILFIAGGTGFAPVKAMIEHLLATNDQRCFELIWGARSRSDLYLDEKVIHWQNHASHFKYCSLLSNESNETLASCAISRHSDDLGEWQIVLSGPFDMVYSTRDVLVDYGVAPAHLFSDAFAFESR
ncbi:NAD(P)H-flavin reductase [Legionella worsleiensis]|uniref:NAD(P)H-flavin reductase n=1 Tax=Legionella worsleiensis TaxID=45076 RepID=A0A0W1AEI6_9GAMM|nr:NAD(P)H-flavin reductase [Legionella worsleiensis]KTD79739.1 NAD(P)H-flavin reductase [Legionella worsleiensis]STY32250.1 NAD(P)H-flavin reductase [Legionella worsleiensis]